MPELTDEQNDVLAQIEAFLDARRVGRQWFSMQGVAGTGKSTVLAELAKRRRGAILCAPTGKAASVLARKTGLKTSTLHSAIYLFRGEYEDEETGERRLSFEPKMEDGDLHGMEALCDEASMVGGTLAGDLLATGCRVIATGDPGQLPPVRDERFFNDADVLLTTVHRQALESPILRQAHHIRENCTYAADGDDFRVTRTVTREDILAADVILCWRNATRKGLNALARAHRGIEGPPRTGEPLMCLRNDHKIGILNGAIYTALNDYGPARALTIVNELGKTITVRGVCMEDFDPPMESYPIEQQRRMHPFALAYAATVHKFQGSEVERGILVDEYNRTDWRKEWLYTGVTRFSKSLVVHSGW